jgi:serine protease AprX
LRHLGVMQRESRANALWGRGGRRAGVLVAGLSVSLVLAASATAAGAGNGNGKGAAAAAPTYVPASLLSAIQQNPKQTFDVILQGDPKGKSRGLLAKILADQTSTVAAGSDSVGATDVRAQYNSIDGVHALLTGRKLQRLIKRNLVTSIMPNEPVHMSAVTLPNMNTQKWAWATGAPVDWNTQATSLTAPTIAIVDSGIDATRADFGGRVLGQVNLSSLTPTATGDDFGHGTFVASVAAGAANGYAGVAPSANLLSVRIMDGQGQTTVADVVAACDWILANKATYNIRVANFSLHAANRASVFFDPLDQAVEKLWLSGVTVVTAAGNYATNGQESGVEFAPGNDPFVITVGAADINNTVTPTDDVSAPWSAWGNTPDGFMKPDLGAPGRYVIGAVPGGAGLMNERPDRIVSSSPGYMQLSGTSFSAPMVAGAAALLLAQHPSWTPDQVKGALMVSASDTPSAARGSLGVGELNIPEARRVTNPPNPNAGLDQYLTTDSTGATVFDSASWQAAAQANPAWDAAAWSNAAWSDAAWSDAAWSDAAWSDAAWSDAAWGDAAWSDAAWSDAAWASAAWGDAAWSDAAWSDAAWSDTATADNANDDPSIDPNATAMTGGEVAQAETNLGIVSPSCDPILSNTCTAP